MGSINFLKIYIHMRSLQEQKEKKMVKIIKIFEEHCESGLDVLLQLCFLTFIF